MNSRYSKIAIYNIQTYTTRSHIIKYREIRNLVQRSVLYNIEEKQSFYHLINSLAKKDTSRNEAYLLITRLTSLFITLK